MALISLRTVTDTQGHTLALKDGTVTPPGFRLAFEDVPVIEAFRRMVRRLDFDVSEMAFTAYLCAREFGKPFTALPAFLVRAFHHGAVVGSVTAGARSPADLAGRKVGLSRGCTVTAGVWARGILQDEYGVDPAAVTWVRAGDEHVAEYQPPPNVVPMPPGADLASLVASGKLAAGIGVPGLTPGQPQAAMMASPTSAWWRAPSGPADRMSVR